MKPQDYLRTSIKTALTACGYAIPDEKLLNLEKPRQTGFGDISSPVAMNMTRLVKQPPRQIAEKIVANFPVDPFFIEKIDIAGPGFINFYLAPSCLQQTVSDILREGSNFGKSDWGGGERIQFEFVSANPTGPLNIVSARAAAVGDVLANLYNWTGFKADREFYINDAGRQVRLLGESLNARYMSELGIATPLPEDGYHGEYIRDLAQEIISRDGEIYKSLPTDERCATFSKMALDYMVNRHQTSLVKYRLHYDHWFRETLIRENQAHKSILEYMHNNNLSYEQDGAVWFRSSQYGDEKDRVLVTSEGEPTYFLIDIAYHQNKYNRGYEKIIDLWGPDHHGYIPRMSAALQALGHPRESFDVLIIQQVNLLRGGEIVKMSKRAGQIIEMDELIEEVGVDAARYFFIDRRVTQPLDFDIDLAKKQTDENPVFYVQYAHARICNILRFARENGVQLPEQADMSPLQNEQEMALIIKLLDFPEVVSKAAEGLEPHRITGYLHETATVFHRFYHENRVVTDDVPLTQARLMLCQATRQVLANGLSLLNISAPENM